jgi:hypothetical protein
LIGSEETGEQGTPIDCDVGKNHNEFSIFDFRFSIQERDFRFCIFSFD